MDATSEPRWAPDTSPAEKELYRAVRAAVGPDVEVLPQVMVTIADHGRPIEVEADLVIVDPEHGITVVEVKGGVPRYDPARASWEQTAGRRKPMRDPVQQAKRARSTIERHLAAERLPMPEIPVRWAVATPECTLESPGESVLPSRYLWDAGSLASIGDAVRQTQGTMTLGEEAIGVDRARLIARLLRGRPVQGTASAVSAVAAHEHQVRVHTESHRNVLHAFAAHRRVLVRGSAGTGKTMLAQTLAARYAAQGDRVLLTCWHRLLAVSLRRQLTEYLQDLGSPVAEAVTDHIGGQVVVNDLASLVIDPGTRPADGTLTEWYYEELPGRLGQSGVAGEFDVIILDEAQDPSELWLTALAGLLRDGGRWYAFADRQQDLFGNAPALAEFVDVDHELRENFRNTTEIANFARSFGMVETDCVSGSGPPVRYHRVPADRVIGRVPEIARKLHRDEGFSPADVAALWLYHNPLQGDPEGLIAQDERGEVVTTNSASFKGMERPVVVLGLDVRDDRSAEDVQRSLYAAATRARSLLVLVGDPARLREAGAYQLAAMFPEEG